MNNAKKIILIFIVIILLVSIPLTVYLAKQQQEIRSQASEELASSCILPGDVSNVKVDYPNCEGDQCSFEQASCSWSSVANATNFNLKITEIETNNIVKQETVSSTITRIVFPVTSGKTYKCDVTAVNSCGQTGGTGTDSKLCVAELIPTAIPTATVPPAPTNTPVPTGIPIPTATPLPTAVIQIPTPTPIVIVTTPIPTLEPGDNKTTVMLGMGSIVLTVLGMILYLLI